LLEADLLLIAFTRISRAIPADHAEIATNDIHLIFGDLPTEIILGMVYCSSAAQDAHGFICRDFPVSRSSSTVFRFSALISTRLILAGLKTQGTYHFMQTVPDRRVGKIEFLFHAIDLALAPDEGHDEIQVFGGQMGERTACEPPLDGRVTGLNNGAG
jgi:hypothetical protein